MKKMLSDIGEFGLIKLIQEKTKVASWVKTGIGDDTAVLKLTSKYQLATTDLLVQDVDFSFGTATPEQIGHKALAVNLSDIAAMGGKPRVALIGLALPKHSVLETLDLLYDGALKLAKKFQVSIVGGDLSEAPVWMVAVTVLGDAPQNGAVLRSGAKEDDLICVTGELGGSILKKHLNFTPRILEGQFIARFGAHAMIDVSDGFLQDLGHVLTASKVSAQVWTDQIPVSKDAVKIGKGNALQHAFTDGEDFELIFTMPGAQFAKMKREWKKTFKTGVRAVGKVINGRPGQIQFFEYGKKIEPFFPKKGYSHFS